jgi:hypothetical protein
MGTTGNREGTGETEGYWKGEKRMNRQIWYKLVDRTPVACDMMDGARAFDGNRHIADTTIGDVRVSTVFLGIDHSFDDGSPLLFETMVFGGELDQEQERYYTWEEAEAGHVRWVEMVQEGATQ